MQAPPYMLMKNPKAGQRPGNKAKSDQWTDSYVDSKAYCKMEWEMWIHMVCKLSSTWNWYWLNYILCISLNTYFLMLLGIQADYCNSSFLVEDLLQYFSKQLHHRGYNFLDVQVYSRTWHNTIHTGIITVQSDNTIFMTSQVSCTSCLVSFPYKLSTIYVNKNSDLANAGHTHWNKAKSCQRRGKSQQWTGQ